MSLLLGKAKMWVGIRRGLKGQFRKCQNYTGFSLSWNWLPAAGIIVFSSVTSLRLHSLARPPHLGSQFWPPIFAPPMFTFENMSHTQWSAFPQILGFFPGQECSRIWGRRHNARNAYWNGGGWARLSNKGRSKRPRAALVLILNPRSYISFLIWPISTQPKTRVIMTFRLCSLKPPANPSTHFSSGYFPSNSDIFGISHSILGELSPKCLLTAFPEWYNHFQHFFLTSSANFLTKVSSAYSPSNAIFGTLPLNPRLTVTHILAQRTSRVIMPRSAHFPYILGTFSPKLQVKNVAPFFPM